MSIDDVYFDLEAAIEAGEFSDGNARMISRILEALTEEEILTRVLRDKIRTIEDQVNETLWNKAEAEHKIKTLKKQVERLKKAS
jgi:hypothetical protein